MSVADRDGTRQGVNVSVRLTHRHYGTDGPPLVVMHGLFGSARNWHSIARRLADDYRVFAVDLRNHGAAPWTDRMSFADMVDDLKAFLDEHHLDEAILLGHSLGGKTAMLFALAHPERVDSLIVVDIAPVAYAHSYRDLIDAMRAVDLTGLSRRGEADAVLADAIPDAALRGFLLQNLVVRDRRLAWRINLDTLGKAMEGLVGFPDPGDTDYEGRTLFISGAHSDYIDQSHYGAIGALFPQAEFAVVADAGHRVHAERPDAFLDAVRGFLDSAYA
jgi:esterase